MNSCCVMDETADVGRSVSGQRHTHTHTHLLLNPSLWIMSEWAAALNTHYCFQPSCPEVSHFYSLFSAFMSQCCNKTNAISSVLYNKLMQIIMNLYGIDGSMKNEACNLYIAQKVLL